MASQTRPPLHNSLRVLNSEEIYRNDEWWKAVVRYESAQNNGNNEVAVYLWHNDDGWTRKNKYVIKTTEAWETDKAIVEKFFSGHTTECSTDEFPVNDYYGLANGKTIFQSNGWWKAILKISQKGSYETEEVMIYLWQERDNDWRRRQKYTIKSQEKWEEERKIIELVLNSDVNQDVEDSGTHRQAQEDESATYSNRVEQLCNDMDKHLSDHTMK